MAKFIKKRNFGPRHPKNISKLSVNSGRKPARISETSYSTIRRRAIELCNNQRYNNIKALEYAIKILKKNTAASTYETELMDIEDNYLVPLKKHTKESTLALTLELKLSKESYIELLKDKKNVNQRIIKFLRFYIYTHLC